MTAGRMPKRSECRRTISTTNSSAPLLHIDSESVHCASPSPSLQCWLIFYHYIHEVSKRPDPNVGSSSTPLQIRYSQNIIPKTKPPILQPERVGSAVLLRFAMIDPGQRESFDISLLLWNVEVKSTFLKEQLPYIEGQRWPKQRNHFETAHRVHKHKTRRSSPCRKENRRSY